MTNPEVISFKRDGNVYRITVGGRILGDSRGYDTADQARTEALSMVAADHASEETKRTGVASRVYRPGF